MASPFARSMNPISTKMRPLPPRPGAKPAGAPVVEVEIEAAESEPPTEPEDPETARMTAGYVGPEQRCNSCAHCDESSTCTLYEFTCEPEGGCPDHESKGGEVSPVPPPTADIPPEEPAVEG